MFATTEKRRGRPLGFQAQAAPGDSAASRLGRHVRALRLGQNMTLHAVAERSGGLIGLSGCARIEAGHGLPSCQAIYGLSVALGVTLDELLTPEVKQAMRREAAGERG